MRRASKYVKNIFIEKPLSHSLDISLKDCEFIKKKNLNIQVGFIERFNPAVIELKSVIEAEEKVINLDFVRTNKLSARITDVDVVSDLMIHDIDLALYLNGPVFEIKAYGYVFNGAIALASANIIHENGSFSRIHASRITDKKMRSIQATCENAFIDCELLRRELRVSRQSMIIQEDGKPYTVSAYEQAIQVPHQEALQAELQLFLRSCNGGNVTKPNEDDGVAAAVVCAQIQEAVFNQ